MLLSPGFSLGRYVLGARIGTGGMAEVWQAMDTSLERQVAIKVMAEDVARDPVYVQRFLREARVTARLEHPNILPIYDFGSEGAVLYLVMPLLSGGTLREKARAGADPEHALGWLRALASALDFAHGEGVIHRDVKPANVLFDRTGRPLLGDFGLAKPIGGEQMTQAGMVMGTPVYMSPEQVRGEQAGPRSDQYALGVLAYYLLTGTPPFEANSVFVVMEKTLREEAELPSRLNAGLHRSVDYVILKAMDKRPEERFEACTAFVTALERAILSRKAGGTGATGSWRPPS